MAFFSPTQPRRAKTRLSAGKAATSESPRRTVVRTSQDLTEVRTTLEAIFNILNSLEPIGDPASRKVVGR
jgi:hypothetical protein